MEINPNDWTLRKLRQYKDFEQKTIAEKLELSISAYGKKELHQRKFDLDEFKKLCEIFDLPMEKMYIIIKNK